MTVLDNYLAFAPNVAVSHHPNVDWAVLDIEMDRNWANGLWMTGPKTLRCRLWNFVNFVDDVDLCC